MNFLLKEFVNIKLFEEIASWYSHFCNFWRLSYVLKCLWLWRPQSKGMLYHVYDFFMDISVTFEGKSKHPSGRLASSILYSVLLDLVGDICSLWYAILQWGVCLLHNTIAFYEPLQDHGTLCCSAYDVQSCSLDHFFFIQ